VDFKSNTRLNTTYSYFTSGLVDSVLTQKRDQENMRMEHNAGVQYVEPWTKKFKTEFNYNFGHNHNTTNRSTYDLLPAGTDIFNPVLSNSFDNFRIIHRTGTKLIYDVKKFRVSAGVQLRNITQTNSNLTTATTLSMNVNNVLPNAGFVYRFNQGSQFQLNYNSNSRLPDLQQMQPVRDVTDPNRISEGNPDLKPTFSNNVNINYWFYKGISDINFWSGGNFGNTYNQISNTTLFDSLGRAVTRPINVDGNYYTGVWFGGGFPMFKRFMKVYLSMNANHNNSVSYVNAQRTISENNSVGPSITLEKNTEKYEVRLEANYDYNVPKNNISTRSQQPYYSYKLSGAAEVKFTKKFFLETDWEYNNNGNRTPGYNLNYFIVNGSLNYAFLKSDNLVVSLMANDILNQNISNERWVTSNQITDTKTQIIRRYFLLRVLFKFNSQQAQADIYED
jgi:outer membrane receptor protein involved in Fe transport